MQPLGRQSHPHFAIGKAGLVDAVARRIQPRRGLFSQLEQGGLALGAIGADRPFVGGRFVVVDPQAFSSGQTRYLTPLHRKANLLKPLIANIRAALQQVKAAAEPLRAVEPCTILLRRVSDKIA